MGFSDLAGVTLQGGITAPAGPSTAGSDKYSALAQLDTAVKEVTLKDSPVSKENSNENWGSPNSNPFGGGGAQPNMQGQQNPFTMAGGIQQQQQPQGFGQFPQQQGGWGQPQSNAFSNPQQSQRGFGNPQQQQGGFGNTQFQGQAGFGVSGGFPQQQQQQQQAMFNPMVQGGAYPPQGGAFPPQGSQWQSQPNQQWSQPQQPQPNQQWAQQQQQQQKSQQWQQQKPSGNMFGGASPSLGASKSATTTTSTNVQLGWSSSVAQPVITTMASSSTSTNSTGWSSGLTAPAPQSTAQFSWNTPQSSVAPPASQPSNWNTVPSGGGTMQQQGWGTMQQGGGWGMPQQQQQQQTFGMATPQQNQMFGGGGPAGYPQQNQMFMGQQANMFGAQPNVQQSFRQPTPQQQPQMFGMSTQQPQQGTQSFGTWQQNSNPQGGFNWGGQTMPPLQKKDSKNSIIVGNWGTQPNAKSDFGSWQQSDTTNNTSTSSNPFSVS